MSKSGFNGKRLKAIRERKAFGAEEFAHELNSWMKYDNERITKRSIARWENEGMIPKNPEIIQCFAAILNCETEDFFDDIASFLGNKESDNRKSSDHCVFQEYLRDFSNFIDNRIQDFTGREFVFDAIDQFVKNNDRGYFFIKGDPGIGKSTIASELVKRNGYIHHFNIRAEGRNKLRQFLENICAQLTLKYNLHYDDIPAEKLQDGELLDSLLHEVSTNRKTDEKIVIVIDSLDEVDNTALSEGANILYLPMNLPEGVYIIATTRPDILNLRIDCFWDELKIEPKSEENQKDIVGFLKTTLKSAGIQTYIKKQKLAQKMFVEYMRVKSEGNFMYLRYVLHEIEEGVYQDLEFSRIPSGLQNYYEDHWRRMGMMADTLPRDKIEIIYVLSEALRPISCELLADFAKKDQLTVQKVIDDWQAFLHKELTEESDRFALYHSSFRDFLNRKDIVQKAGIDIGDIKDQITDSFFE